ncbi:hypothetical protein AB0J86_09045 [Micromonospora sp. NPDC049559]|uniref:hypothetical protein n=1 Tax=Micromonospora sp. NPDC049559 TaxID=3155923 RepID=UPI00343B1573
MTPGRLDETELLALDVPALLAVGLASPAGPAGNAAVAAALAAARLGTEPRSLTFLAEVVRVGGVGYAAGLAEPLPTAGQRALAASWLAAAAGVADDPDRDEVFARWLDKVATIVAVRRAAA